MTDETFDRDFWEERWAQVRSDHPDALAGRPPNAHVLAELADLPPGRAVDAGVRARTESIWLAAGGWHVTAVDFSATALDIARSTAASVGAEVAGRIEWVEGDLGTWTPPEATFDLVLSVYVHVEGSVPEMVRRLGSGVAPGGSLFLFGHLPVDPPREADNGGRAGAGSVNGRWTAWGRATGTSCSPRSDAGLRPAVASTQWCARPADLTTRISRSAAPVWPSSRARPRIRSRSSTFTTRFRTHQGTSRSALTRSVAVGRRTSSRASEPVRPAYARRRATGCGAGRGVTPNDEKASCTSRTPPSGTRVAQRRSSRHRPVVVLAVDVEQVDRAVVRRARGPRGRRRRSRPGRRRRPRRGGPEQVVPGRRPPYRHAGIEGVDRDERGRRRQRRRQHHRRPALVAADLHDGAAVRQRPAASNSTVAWSRVSQPSIGVAASQTSRNVRCCRPRPCSWWHR